MASTLNMTLQRIPDIIVTTVIVDAVNSAILFFGPAQWTGESATIVVDVEPGTELEYYAINSVSGGVNRGTTV